MTSTSDRFAPPSGISRNAAIAGGVVVLHVAILWAVQSGLLRKAVEVILPVEMISEFIEPPAPKEIPPPPRPQPTPVKRTVTKAPTPPPAPRPLAIADPTPAPNAPTGVLTPQPPAPPIDTPVAATPAPAAPPAAPSIVLPSSNADYLQNPKPAYPPMSKRLGEQGKVMVRVFIGVDGLPQRAEVTKSSGYDRLDQAAVSSVMRWKFVPGKRNGVPEAMWNNVPFNWVLE